ncbi:tetratricopeptide repeat protein [Cruoricaptor ignavus]|uniref:Tetratricopeptide repeat protein n=1 Tax=Cruoricaptor ignavus TaxID=1118202 RepID=A0A7M1T092_9FLAO|nr:tetratricopeptide repeat protein [Cruoricaptor ignavus]QOR73256.1 tetratricopeptide repeat protein [Cruoricaptor ignavus]
MEEFFENELAKKFEQMVETGEQTYFDSEELEDIIIYYLEIGDINLAELAVNFARQLHPNSIELKTKELEVLLELENYPAAKKIIRELRDLGMESTDFFVCCAKYYSNLGNPQKSIEYCEKALEFEQEEDFLHNFIADEFVNLNDPFNALKHYKLALQYEPQDDYALENIMFCYAQLQRHDEAINFLNDYINQFPFSETAWNEYGQFYFSRKNYEEAIRGFDYLLAINSDAIGVYANKAACYEAMKQWENAIEVYEELLEIEFTKAYTYYKIGLCYREMQQPMKALKAFQKSLVEDPQFYLSMMEQSAIYEENGQLVEALHFAREAVALNEGDVEFQKRLAFLYIDSGMFEQSVACLRKIVEIEPGRFYNWYAYSEVLMLLHEYEEAITILNQAIKIHNRAELFYQISNCLYILDYEEDAKLALEKALEMDDSIYNEMVMKYPTIKGKGKKPKRTKK